MTQPKTVRWLLLILTRKYLLRRAESSSSPPTVLIYDGDRTHQIIVYLICVRVRWVWTQNFLGVYIIGIYANKNNNKRSAASSPHHRSCSPPHIELNINVVKFDLLLVIERGGRSA